MINVLFIAVEFPPLNTTGGKRPLKFVKYLRGFGINPIVLTVDETGGMKTFNSVKSSFGAKPDYGLLRELPAEVTVYRVPIDFPKFQCSRRRKRSLRTYFKVTDGVAEAWEKNVMAEIGKIIGLHKPQAVYVTYPPSSAPSLAIKISKKSRLPIILDMRDAFSRWCTKPYRSRLHYRLAHNLEEKWFRESACVIGITKTLADDFAELHPGIDKNKFHVIPNGFDDETVLTVDECRVDPLGKKGHFDIGYLGSFYYSPERWAGMFTPWWKKKGREMLHYTPRREDTLYKTPLYFFKALNKLFERRGDLADKVGVHFVGENPQWLLDMVEDNGLLRNCFFHGQVGYGESLSMGSSFDALLTTGVKIENFADYCMPSKLFDYVSLLKPIIGFVFEGEQKEFIENSGMGFICNPDDTAGSSNVLEKIIDGGYSLRPNKAYLEKFTRKNLTGRLAELILDKKRK